MFLMLLSQFFAVIWSPKLFNFVFETFTCAGQKLKLNPQKNSKISKNLEKICPKIAIKFDCLPQNV